MELAYTAEQTALQERAAAYTRLLFAHEDAVESSGGHLDEAVQRELEQAARDAGLWAINMPVEWGGAGLSVVEQLIVQEQLGKATNCLWDFCWWPANVLAYGTAEQRERYLLPVIRGERRDAFAVTEAEAGSDAGGIRTTATRVDDGWRIDGEKWFVTCGDVADFLIVHANAVTGDATPSPPSSSSTRTCRAWRSCTRRRSCTPRCSATRRSVSTASWCRPTRCWAGWGRASS